MEPTSSCIVISGAFPAFILTTLRGLVSLNGLVTDYHKVGLRFPSTCSICQVPSLCQLWSCEWLACPRAPRTSQEPVTSFSSL